jgi:hypothetical protein
MPAIRRPNLSHRTRNNLSQRATRANHSVEQRRSRNEGDRMRRIIIRQNNTHDTFNIHRLAFHYNKSIDYSSMEIVKIGSMDTVCQYCKALRFKNEAPGLCCASGKIKLMPLLPPPEPLLSLVSGNGPASKHFLTNIQQYNNCFQMTSFGATKVFRENFMPTFKVNTFYFIFNSNKLTVIKYMSMIKNNMIAIS